MAPAASSLINKAAASEHFGTYDELFVWIVTFCNVIEGFHFTFVDHMTNTTELNV